MSRRQKVIVVLVKVVPVLIIVAAAALHVVRQANHLIENINQVIAAELSHTYARTVSIGKTTVTPLGTVILRDISIGESEDSDADKLLSADEIRVHYGWRGLLLGGKGVQSVREVEVLSPHVSLVRQKDGTLNLVEIFKPKPGPKKPPFKGVVKVKDAVLDFKDYLAHTQNLPAVNSFKDLNGHLDVTKHPVYKFRLSANGQPDRVESVRIVGVFDPESRLLRTDIDASKVSAVYWADYFSSSDAVDVRDGLLKIMVGVRTTLGKPEEGHSVTGLVEADAVALRIAGFGEELTQTTGLLTLGGDTAAVSMETTLAGSAIDVQGLVKGFSDPQLEFNVASPNVDLARILSAIKLPAWARSFDVGGRGPVRARVAGTAADWGVEASLRAPSLAYGDYAFENVSLGGAYRGKRVRVDSLSFGTMGGQVRARGSLGLSGPVRLAFEGRANNLDLSAVPIAVPVDVAGTASGDFTVSGTSSAPVISSDISISDGVVDRVPFELATARVQVDRNQAKIRDLKVSGVAGGVISGSGDLTAKQMRVSAVVEACDIAEIAAAYDKPDYGGKVYFSGDFTGPWTRPHMSGDLEIFDGQYNKNMFNYARATLSGSPDSVEVDNAVVRLFPAEVRFAGGVQGIRTGRVAFDGEAHVKRLRMGLLASLLGRDIDAQGTISADFEGRGAYLKHPSPGSSPVVDLNAGGSLELSDGTAFGYPINTAVARLAVDDNSLLIEEAVVTSADARLVVEGDADLDRNELDFTFDLQGFDAARAHGRFADYLRINGMVSAQGTVKGDWREPDLDVTGGVDGLSLNGSSFDQAQFASAFSPKRVGDFTASLGRGSQVYNIQASGLNFHDRSIDAAQATVSNVSVPDLWRMLLASPYLSSEDAVDLRESLAHVPPLSSGTINGELSISGSLDRPDGDMKLSAQSVGLDSRQIESIEAEATSTGGVIVLDQLLALSGDMFVSAVGDPLYKDGQVRLDLTAQNLDMAQLRPWLQEKPVSGVMSAEFIVEGDRRSPYVKGSVEVVDPSYAGVSFDRLRASSIEIVDDAIQLADIILAVGPHQLSAGGHIPWDWSGIEIPEDRPLEIAARLNEQDLSVLSAFVPEVQEEGTTGVVEGNLTMSGTIAAPELNGALTVKDGTIAARSFINDFTDVNVDVSFDGNTVQLNEFSASSSEGGTLGIEPGGYVAFSGPGAGQVNMFLFADQLVLEERNLLRLRESVDVELDAGLSVFGDLMAPMVSDAQVGDLPGGVRISNSRISFAVPEKVEERAQAQLAVNPVFDVTVELGDDVWIAPPAASLLVVGDGRLAGSLAEPHFGLDLEIERGSLGLASARLAVVPGGTVAVEYSPPEDPVVRLNLRGSTTVTATSPLGQRERYDIQVAVTGTIANMQIDLSSSPAGLSREQMLAALGHVESIFASAESGLQGDLAKVLTAVGTSAIFAPIENVFVEQLGFEEFALEYSGDSPLSLFISRRLFGNFYISYFQRLTSDFSNLEDTEYEFNLSYRLKNRYQLGVGVDDQQSMIVRLGLTKAFN